MSCACEKFANLQKKKCAKRKGELHICAAASAHKAPNSAILQAWVTPHIVEAQGPASYYFLFKPHGKQFPC
jgi:hypothetical protein